MGYDGPLEVAFCDFKLETGRAATKKPKAIVLATQVESKILLIHGQKVLLDSDLAELYGVPTKRLNEQVRRNRGRFPADFMFQLGPDDARNLRSQIATSKGGRGGRRYRPTAFTEQGVAMLSSVLRSKRAVMVNVEIMRAFVRLRKVLSEHATLARRLDDLEKNYDSKFRVVFEAIRQLMAPTKPARQIGFQP